MNLNVFKKKEEKKHQPKYIPKHYVQHKHNSKSISPSKSKRPAFREKIIITYLPNMSKPGSYQFQKWLKDSRI